TLPKNRSPTLSGLGIAFSDQPAITEYVRFGQMAEELGYESVWVTEPRLARDGVTGMAILAATTSLRLGTAVLNNWTRGPALMAVTFRTLAQLAPGRIMLGLGGGWDPLMKN